MAQSPHPDRCKDEGVDHQPLFLFLRCPCSVRSCFFRRKNQGGMMIGCILIRAPALFRTVFLTPPCLNS